MFGYINLYLIVQCYFCSIQSEHSVRLLQEYMPPPPLNMPGDDISLSPSSLTGISQVIILVLFCIIHKNLVKTVYVLFKFKSGIL